MLPSNYKPRELRYLTPEGEELRMGMAFKLNMPKPVLALIRLSDHFTLCYPPASIPEAQKWAKDRTEKFLEVPYSELEEYCRSKIYEGKAS